jgi:hypothetical protein
VHRFVISSKTWLACVLAYAFIALALDAWAISRWERHTQPEVAGSLGVKISWLDAHYRFPISELTADSPLAAAGARIGDTIVFDKPTDRSRWLVKTDQVGLTLYRDGAGRHMVVTASADNPARETVRSFVFNWTGNVFAVLCGILIGVRRSEPGPHRLLSILLVTVGYGSEFHILPNPAQDLFFTFVAPFLWVAGWQLFTLFALVFPTEAPLMRHTWVRRAYLALLASSLAELIVQVAVQNALVPGAALPMLNLSVWIQWNNNACVVGGLSALMYSWWRSEHLTRQKMMWITLSLGVFYLSWVLGAINLALGSPLPPLGLADGLTVARCAASVLLAYALLSRRVFDAGFALNRALVVTIISAALLVVFAVTEFAVDKLLHFHGRETNVMIDAAVALGVILCFHRIQHWVNHQVNHFFFHHWYEAAERLRAFMRSAMHVTDADALQRKFIEAVERFGGTAGVAIYLAGDDGAFVARHGSLVNAASRIDANDDLVIRLRDERDAVELDRAVAFPIVVRGALSGIVLVDGKLSGHPYRPDEIALMKSATQQLGADLESLRVVAIERELARAHQMQRTLSDRCETFERVLIDKLDQARA